MSEGMEGMNDQQLKRRKVLAVDFKILLNKELVFTQNRIDKIDGNMEGNPSPIALPYSTWTIGQLNDMKKALSHNLSRLRLMETDVKAQFKGVDIELVARQ